MQKWEYLRIAVNWPNNSVGGHVQNVGKPNKKISADEYVATLGDDGWELVAAATVLDVSIVLYFKRPKQ